MFKTGDVGFDSSTQTMQLLGSTVGDRGLNEASGSGMITLDILRLSTDRLHYPIDRPQSPDRQAV